MERHFRWEKIGDKVTFENQLSPVKTLFQLKNEEGYFLCLLSYSVIVIEHSYSYQDVP